MSHLRRPLPRIEAYFVGVAHPHLPWLRALSGLWYGPSVSTQILDTVLLFSLPASGKSEVRRYLASLTPEQAKNDFHMGPTLQLDDYPYVHFMHRIDDELKASGLDYAFYRGPHRPFRDDWEWAALVELLNDDFDDLIQGRQTTVSSAAQHLFDRLDAAHAKVGLPEFMGDLPYRVRKRIAEAMEAECRAELDAKNQTCSQDPKGKTIVIEAARGGPNGAAFPLTPPVGYQSTFQQLSEEILSRATVLYIWVEPEESRRKNIERGRPDGQGSILHHSVPMEVMLGQYGCDDMGWLLERSDRPNTVRVERIFADEAADGSVSYRDRIFHLPTARFDNRKDLTSFVRSEQSSWKKEDIAPLHDGLGKAFSLLASTQGSSTTS